MIKAADLLVKKNQMTRLEKSRDKIYPSKTHSGPLPPPKPMPLFPYTLKWTAYKGLTCVSRNWSSHLSGFTSANSTPQAANRTGQFTEQKAEATAVRKLGEDPGWGTRRLRFLSWAVLKVPKSERILPFIFFPCFWFYHFSVQIWFPF